MRLRVRNAMAWVTAMVRLDIMVDVLGDVAWNGAGTACEQRTMEMDRQRRIVVKAKLGWG
jgi:hypothetical protein